jgi:hypothetical protein
MIAAQRRWRDGVVHAREKEDRARKEIEPRGRKTLRAGGGPRPEGDRAAREEQRLRDKSRWQAAHACGWENCQLAIAID